MAQRKEGNTDRIGESGTKDRVRVKTCLRAVIAASQQHARRYSGVIVPLAEWNDTAVLTPAKK